MLLPNCILYGCVLKLKPKFSQRTFQPFCQSQIIDLRILDSAYSVLLRARRYSACLQAVAVVDRCYLTSTDDGGEHAKTNGQSATAHIPGAALPWRPGVLTRHRDVRHQPRPPTLRTIMPSLTARSRGSAASAGHRLIDAPPILHRYKMQ